MVKGGINRIPYVSHHIYLFKVIFFLSCYYSIYIGVFFMIQATTDCLDVYWIILVLCVLVSCVLSNFNSLDFFGWVFDFAINFIISTVYINWILILSLKILSYIYDVKCIISKRPSCNACKMIIAVFTVTFWQS